MRERSELKGEYAQKFENDNQEELKNAISEAGLSCCSYCEYITDEPVRYKDYDFIQQKIGKLNCEILCDNCYEYMYSLELVKPIKEH